MAEELEEEEEQPGFGTPPESEKRIVARFLDLVAAGFVALAVTTGFDGEYGRTAVALGAGLLVFLCGLFWDILRSAIGPVLSSSAYRVASSAWSWLAVLY